MLLFTECWWWWSLLVSTIIDFFRYGDEALWRQSLQGQLGRLSWTTLVIVVGWRCLLVRATFCLLLWQPIGLDDLFIWRVGKPFGPWAAGTQPEAAGQNRHLCKHIMRSISEPFCKQFLLLVYMYNRAGEFPKNFMHLAQKRVFGPKNAPKKRGSSTPNSPSEIWAIVTTLIKILVNTITQILEGENWA